MEQISRPSGAPYPWSFDPEAERLAQSTILLVEDDPDIREMVRTVLSMAGLTVEAYPDAESALTALRESHFDLIVTDYSLPKNTGTWLLHQARAEGLIPDTPALIVTAHPSVDGKGDDEVIQKPFDLDDLIERVRRRMGDASGARRRRVRTPERPSGDGTDGGGSDCPEPIELILYISRHSPRSYVALRNVRQILSRFDPARVRLTVWDLSVNPEKGEQDAVPCTPPLVRKTPGPRTFILGHLMSPEVVLELLADCGEWG